MNKYHLCVIGCRDAKEFQIIATEYTIYYNIYRFYNSITHEVVALFPIQNTIIEKIEKIKEK